MKFMESFRANSCTDLQNLTASLPILLMLKAQVRPSCLLSLTVLGIVCFILKKSFSQIRILAYPGLNRMKTYFDATSSSLDIMCILKAHSSYQIDLYSVTGSHICMIDEGANSALELNLRFPVTNLPVGVYFVRMMSSTGESNTAKVVIY